MNLQTITKKSDLYKKLNLLETYITSDQYNFLKKYIDNLPDDLETQCKNLKYSLIRDLVNTIKDNETNPNMVKQKLTSKMGFSFIIDSITGVIDEKMPTNHKQYHALLARPCSEYLIEELSKIDSVKKWHTAKIEYSGKKKMLRGEHLRPIRFFREYLVSLVDNRDSYTKEELFDMILEKSREFNVAELHWLESKILDTTRSKDLVYENKTYKGLGLQQNGTEEERLQALQSIGFGKLIHI